MIHQSSIYINIMITHTIEIYVHRLSTTMQIFMAMDYLILMSKKYVCFRKRQKNVLRNFSPRISN